MDKRQLLLSEGEGDYDDDYDDDYDYEKRARKNVRCAQNAGSARRFLDFFTGSSAWCR